MSSSLGKEGIVRILKTKEGKLAAAFKGVLDEFCLKLFRRNVITNTLLDNFMSLGCDRGDRHLDQNLMIRYLLHHVYDAILDKRSVVRLFVEVVEQYDKSLADELCSKLKEMPSGTVVEASQAGEYRLSEHDVQILTELLVSVSDKVEELGLALGLQEYRRAQCRKDCSNIIALSNVLLEWIRTTNHCTLDKLKMALSSRTVGRPKTACDLEQKFQPTHEPQINSDYHIVYQSGDTTCVYGKPTLLGFLTSSDKPGKYQWRLNGGLLSNNNMLYSGADTAFLFIKCVCGQTEGSYECQVLIDGRVKSSEKIELTGFYSENTEKFAEIYSIQNEIVQEKWPPVANKKFINLSLVKKGNEVNGNFEYAVLHDMDDIIASKESIEYKQAFGKYEKGKVVLVEGRPGSGKTTLMHKLARDWAIHKNILLGAEIVVLVPLRLLSRMTNEDITLSDIFKMYLEGARQRSEFIQSVQDDNGKGICFIVDGLDEYKNRTNRSSVIYKLIHKQELRLSMVIVASRPIGTASIRDSVSVHSRIEVLGFKNDQIKNYIKSYFMSNEEMALKLQSYLKIHINVLRLCYLPVHAAMVCFLYSKEGDNIPHSETKIYESFTRLTLIRDLNCDESRPRIYSLQSLPENIQKSFNIICGLAFDMVINSKQVIKQSETQFQLSYPDSNTFPLSLVTVDSTAELFGMEDVYAFLHLTFQEYLAAFYLAGLNED